MRVAVMVRMGAALLVAACVAERDPAGAARLAAPRFAQSQNLDGTPAADLIVDTTRLAHSWLVYDQDLVAQDLCAQFEGGVTPGVHRVLRFTVTTPNVGTADLVIGNPLDHVRAQDGLFEFASCHLHFHMRHFASYELVSVGTGQPKLIRAAKKGFCMIDDTPWQFAGGVGSPNFRTCGTFTIPGNQGISVGWADTYDKHIGGQYSCWTAETGRIPFRRASTSSGSRSTRRSSAPTSIEHTTGLWIPGACATTSLRATTTTMWARYASPFPTVRVRQDSGWGA